MEDNLLNGYFFSCSGAPFTIVTLEDGTFAVVRSDPGKPRLLEITAITLTPHAPGTTPTQKTAHLLSPEPNRQRLRRDAALNQLRQHRNSVRANAPC